MIKTIGIKCNNEEEIIETKKITNQQYKKLLSIIEENRFYSMPQDISAKDILDGYYIYLTTTHDIAFYTVGGHCADLNNKKFKNITDFIKELAQ